MLKLYLTREKLELCNPYIIRIVKDGKTVQERKSLSLKETFLILNYYQDLSKII